MRIISNSFSLNGFPSSSNDLSSNYVWQIWMLRISGNGIITSNKLFYSWIVPTYLDSRGWQEQTLEFADNVQNRQDKNVKVELIRGDYYGSGTTIQRAINEIFSKTLAEVVWQDEDAYPPNVFLNLTLQSAIAENYVVRPEIMIPIEHSLIPWASKSIPSPVFHSLFISQIIKLNKIDVITFSEYQFSQNSIKEIIKGISEKFRDSTSFDITRASAPRVGNIEWYRLPISNAFYRPLVTSRAAKTDEQFVKGVIVSFLPLPDKISKNISIRCRITNGEEITIDQLRNLVWNSEGIEESFMSEQPISDVDVTVWEKAADNNWNIIFEEHHTFLRHLVTQMSIGSSSINSGRINLLDTKRLRNEEKTIPIQLAQYNRSTLGYSLVMGGNGNDAWVESSREIISWMKGFFPEKSKGHFFLNGWDEKKGKSGQLSFVEWLLDTISGKEKGGLILIDPFFDKGGLEIFANVRTTNTRCQILTCTQHRDKFQSESQCDKTDVVDMAVLMEEQLNQHAVELSDACQHMLPLLAGLDFHLFDLRSKAAGTRSLFHDRYLLLTDHSGVAKEGFHLSNSIQGATRNEPILITPIPEDILPDVIEYVKGLINSNGPSNKQTEIATLYPINRKDGLDKASTVKRERIDEVPDIRLLLSVLFKDDKLLQYSTEDLKNFLTDQKLLDARSNSFLIYNVSPEQLELFAKKLDLSDAEEFKKLTNAWGNILARGHSYDPEKTNYGHQTTPPYDAKKQLTNTVLQYSSISDKLVKYLNEFSESKKVLGYRDRLYGIFNANTFEEGIEIALQNFAYIPGEYHPTNYGLHYAVKLFVYSFPEATSQFTDNLISQITTAGWDEGNALTKSKLLLLTTLANALFDYSNRVNLPLQELLLKSSILTVRTASCAALYSGLSINYLIKPDPDNVLKTLKKSLSKEEFQMFLAFAISNLQISNRQNGGISQDKLFEILITDFEGDSAFITRLSKILSGPLPFNRSDFITKMLFNPLIQLNKFDALKAFTIWNNAFLNKVKYRENYQDGSSDDTINNFCANTDIELTVALLNAFLELAQEHQNSIILEWINAVADIWNVVNQPFAVSKNYHHSCIRLFWMDFVIKMIKKNNLLSDEANKTVEDFIDKHKVSMLPVEIYVKALDYNGVKNIESIEIIRQEPNTES